MLTLCLLSMVCGFFNGSVSALEMFILGKDNDKLSYFFSYAKISWDNLIINYEIWLIVTMIGLFYISGLQIGNIYIPFIPRQFYRKVVAEKLDIEYIPKTVMAETLIVSWYDLGLKNQKVFDLSLFQKEIE